jgi:SAM-dependent methyltransferase
MVFRLNSHLVNWQQNFSDVGQTPRILAAYGLRLKVSILRKGTVHMSGQTIALSHYRNSLAEIARTRDLMAIVPKNLSTVLDIGARDGHFSQLLTQHFKSVTALDLTMPQFNFEGVHPVQGDVTRLQFPDSSFDVVFCAEVLEHVPAIEKACSEIARVARQAIVIGVPYRQDTRLGRTTCNHCGNPNPPWGHVNIFDEHKVSHLFSRCRLIGTSFVGSTNDRTNPVSTWLMDLAGNPWGVYDQEEPCIHCGKRMSPPISRPFTKRMIASAAQRLNRLQSPFNPTHPNWIHLVFQKS